MRELRERGHGFPFPADGAATLAAEQDHSMNGTGFRLAVVNDFETYAGSRYIFPAGGAASMRIGHNGPSEKYKNLGIRLVRESA